MKWSEEEESLWLKKRKERKKPDANLPGSPPPTSSGWQRVCRPNRCFSARSFLEPCQDIVGAAAADAHVVTDESGARPPSDPSRRRLRDPRCTITILHVFFISLVWWFKRRFIKCFPPGFSLSKPFCRSDNSTWFPGAARRSGIN